VPSIRLKIADLYEFDGQTVPDPLPGAEVVGGLVARQFGFLPQPVTSTVEGDEVVVEFNRESPAAIAEANRLALKAGKKAAEGDNRKAIDLLRRVLQLHPSLHSARRDLAMAYAELKDTENAINHLIEVLRLDPKDAWSLVVLANLYLGGRKDPDTAEKFLRKALTLKPNDAWAINSLAALHHKRGQYDEAVKLFEQAIAANPEFANPYYGEALAFDALHQPADADAVLMRLFRMGKLQDARTQSVYTMARQLYPEVQKALAHKLESDSFKCVQTYKVELEALSGYPVREEEDDFRDKLGARIQMAWKHGRDHHVIITRRGYDPLLLCHLQAHELTHLHMEADARAAGKNLFFATTPESRDAAFRAVGSDLEKLKRAGYPEDTVTKMLLTMIGGLSGFLFNCPLDMLIESRLRRRFPVLRPAQFLSISALAEEALKAATHPEVVKITPRRIMRANLALGGAYALFLEELFEGAALPAAPYRKMEGFDTSKRLFQHWKQRAPNLSAGDEYGLVDEFADMVGIRDWYTWMPDSGHHDITDTTTQEGSSNDALLRAKHPAAVWYLLSALERFDKLTTEQIREIAFEIGALGQNGLDYASPDEKYVLKTLPGERFSGLQLMCIMYAGFKRFAPEVDGGIDLDAPFLQALVIYEKRKKEGGGSA
jgi:tetratricopeptide (TPR) repeat protein